MASKHYLISLSFSLSLFFYLGSITTVVVGAHVQGFFACGGSESRSASCDWYHASFDTKYLVMHHTYLALLRVSLGRGLVRSAVWMLYLVPWSYELLENKYSSSLSVVMG